jgi:hypothetical protein
MVIAVITILTTVFLFQQRRFDSSTLLRSLAYSVALSVRQAQVYGTSARQFGTSFSSTAGANFNYNYGVYIARGDLQNFYLFADLNGDKQYQSNEQVQQFKIGQGYSVSQYCVTRSTSQQDCSSGGKNGGTTADWLTIFFKRPNPDACFATSFNTTGCGTGAIYTNATIKLTGPSDVVTWVVTITSTGQISVATGALGL